MAKMGDKALSKGGMFDSAMRRLPARFRPGRRTRRVSMLLLVVVLLMRVTQGGWRSADSQIAHADGSCPEHEPGSRGDAAVASLRKRLSDILESDEVQRDTTHLDDTRFTVVLNTFKRRDLLKKAVKHYATCPDIREIRVVWSEQVPPPSPNDADADLYFPLRKSGKANSPEIVYDSHFSSTSIQNRFEVSHVRTTSVFNIDDDVRIPCGTLSKGFKVWRMNKNVLVGYFPRLHVWHPDKCQHTYVWDDISLWKHSQFSIILTKAAFMSTEYLRLYEIGLPDAARKYIDARKNCEDIAMQLLQTAVSNSPPVWVKPPYWHYWFSKVSGIGVAGISKGASHHDLRGKCVTDLSRFLLNGVDENAMWGEKYGDTPLLVTAMKPWSE